MIDDRDKIKKRVTQRAKSGGGSVGRVVGVCALPSKKDGKSQQAPVDYPRARRLMAMETRASRKRKAPGDREPLLQRTSGFGAIFDRF